VGKIVISENVTIDAVVRDPAGDAGLRVGGWVGLIRVSSIVLPVAAAVGSIVAQAAVAPTASWW
jgi:hypothetical protein